MTDPYLVRVDAEECEKLQKEATEAPLLQKRLLATVRHLLTENATLRRVVGDKNKRFLDYLRDNGSLRYRLRQAWVTFTDPALNLNRCTQEQLQAFDELAEALGGDE